MDDVFEASCFTMRRVVRHRTAIADPIWVVLTLSKTEAHSVTSLCNGNGCPTEPSTSIVEATVYFSRFGNKDYKCQECILTVLKLLKYYVT